MVIASIGSTSSNSVIGRPPEGTPSMGDVLGVLLTALLLLANAFFVGSEFALISARRDRLEALADRASTAPSRLSGQRRISR